MGPPQDLTAAVSNLDLHTNSVKPTADQCLAHLKILEAFHQLREDVATTDGLYGLHDHFAGTLHPGQAPSAQRAQLLLKIREKRWAIYVTKATHRFQKWWHKTSPLSSPEQQYSGLLHQYKVFGQDNDRMTITDENIPPLDVDPWRNYSEGNFGRGYTDPGFEMVCSGCHVSSNHDTLKVHKFKTDCKMLVEKNRPLPGTVLNARGRPQPPEGNDTMETHSPLFPNRLIRALQSPLLEQLDRSWPSLNDVRKVIETGLKNTDVLQKSRGGIFPPSRKEKLAVRKMMSHYWSNSSVFALDLVGAVIRQGTFIEKMHAIDWLHSPAARSTMDRLLLKYDRFIYILAHNPGRTTVPTLDVDLAWHTHQLSPPNYYRHTVSKADRFIDHDDKIPSITLSAAFEWTSKVYQTMYQEAYSECTCWYCAAIRESHTSAATRHIFSRSTQKKIEAKLSNTNDGDLKSPPHISAHSAIDPKDFGLSMLVSMKNAKLDRMYEKARKRAEKKGQHPPNRGDAPAAGYTNAYGVPIDEPVEVRSPLGRAQRPCAPEGLGVVAVGMGAEEAEEAEETEEEVEEGTGAAGEGMGEVEVEVEEVVEDDGVQGEGLEVKVTGQDFDCLTISIEGASGDRLFKRRSLAG
ncbi:MAG: hypothetical protein Q9220_002696 [cf. Caloplaca sp. 1 TL-2023]